MSAPPIDADLKAALEAGFSISGTDVEAPGSVNWTYPVTDAFDFLDAGETITLTYTVTITDNNNATDTDTVPVTITGTNDAPVISAGIDDFGFTEATDAAEQALSSSGTLSFTDIDTNAVIDVSSAVTTAAVWSGGDIDADLKAALKPASPSQAPMSRLRDPSTGPTPSPMPSTSSMPAKPSR